MKPPDHLTPEEYEIALQLTPYLVTAPRHIAEAGLVILQFLGDRVAERRRRANAAAVAKRSKAVHWYLSGPLLRGLYDRPPAALNGKEGA